MGFKLTNTTDMKADTIRKIIRFCMPKNVKVNFTLRVSNSDFNRTPFTVPEGAAAPSKARFVKRGEGSNGVASGYSLYEHLPPRYAGSYYSSIPPHIVLRVSKDWHPILSEPYQYAQHKGRKFLVGDRIEALVYIAAHELRHMWQEHGKHKNAPFPEGYVRNSRGGMSEVDTEAYALHMLRRWRHINFSKSDELAVKARHERSDEERR